MRWNNWIYLFEYVEEQLCRMGRSCFHWSWIIRLGTLTTSKSVRKSENQSENKRVSESEWKWGKRGGFKAPKVAPVNLTIGVKVDLIWVGISQIPIGSDPYQLIQDSFLLYRPMHSLYQPIWGHILVYCPKWAGQQIS